MEAIDYSFVGGYLVCLLVFGIYLSKRASQGADHYFLGGRSLPWWALGASGMSSNLDAAGTITIIALIYQFGMHGFFIEARGGMVLPIAVFIAFMGKWHRRSEVMTTAEWMELRFGSGWGGKAARLIAALTYLVITIGMVVFFLAAAGKFLAVFLPFSETVCAVIMALIALVYTMISGLYGVIWTDVFQAFFIALAAVIIGMIGYSLVTPELLESWPGAAFNQAIPQWSNSGLAPYELFGLFLIAWVAKGLLEGLGGSGGSAYMAQRFYAARSDTECKKIGMLWVLLFSFRWPLVLGLVLIAIHLGIGQEDPERILPAVLNSDFFPAGLRGLVVASIFAASMSTFDSTINAGASYVVKDIFQLVKPQASERALVMMGYLASVGIVASGLFLALAMADSVVAVWVTIVIQLFPAFLIPFALRWFWGRFNGTGFSLGVLSGFAASLGVTLAPFSLNEIATLGLISGISLLGCLVGTFAGPKVPTAVSRAFYDRIRPLGWWPKPWRAPHRREHRGDVLRLAVSVFWQIATFMLPMLAILHQWTSLAALALPWLAATVYLLRETDSPETPAPAPASQPH